MTKTGAATALFRSPSARQRRALSKQLWPSHHACLAHSDISRAANCNAAIAPARKTRFPKFLPIRTTAISVSILEQTSESFHCVWQPQAQTSSASSQTLARSPFCKRSRLMYPTSRWFTKRLGTRTTNKWSADDPGANTESSSLIAKNQTTADANAVEVEVVDIIAFIENLDRDVRIIKMDIEGAEWEIMNRLVDHPVLSRIDCIFVETHERIDPAKYVPMFDALQERAEQLSKPYINL